MVLKKLCILTPLPARQEPLATRVCKKGPRTGTSRFARTRKIDWMDNLKKKDFPTTEQRSEVRNIMYDVVWVVCA